MHDKHEVMVMAMERAPIDAHPDKMSGAICVGDTRMPVEDFFIHLTQGGSIHTFSERYGMEVDELRAVLRFATHDLGKDIRAIERAHAWVVSRAAPSRSSQAELV